MMRNPKTKMPMKVPLLIESAPNVEMTKCPMQHYNCVPLMKAKLYFIRAQNVNTKKMKTPEKYNRC